MAAASFQRNIALPAHPDNGDEARYADRSASYSKALPHNAQGDVDTNEYNKLLTALRSGRGTDIELLGLRGLRTLVNPLAAYAYQLEGADSHALAIPAAPVLASEMAELYWMALARDIPFDSYAVDGRGIINTAVKDLNGFRDVRAPKVSGTITPQTLFRDIPADSLVGSFVSQYLVALGGDDQCGVEAGLRGEVHVDPLGQVAAVAQVAVGRGLQGRRQGTVLDRQPVGVGREVVPGWALPAGLEDPLRPVRHVLQHCGPRSPTRRDSAG